MDDEDRVKKLGAAYSVGQDLSTYSIDELADLVGILEEEIGRINDTRSEKSTHMNAAEALFKS